MHDSSARETKMLGLSELKERIRLTDTTVECPVKGCRERVARQRRSFRRDEKFRCPRHRIYISPSTFEYDDQQGNILWREKTELDLLEQVKSVKRESRIARDNSEDAVTWNVFRFLEREDIASGYLSTLTGSPVGKPEVIYWSYSRLHTGPWIPLTEARRVFERRPLLGSEPDVIIRTDRELFLIEAKLTSGNNTVLRSKDPAVKIKYESGGNNWYTRVFKSDLETVAISERKYELMRFWLIGTWIAKHLDVDFYLVNLVPSQREKDIENIFKKHIAENQHRTFLRAPWEDIYECILKSNMSGRDRGVIIRYFQNKTLGYDEQGKLQRAFLIE